MPESQGIRPYAVVSSLEVDARKSIAIIDSGALFSRGTQVFMVKTRLSPDQLLVLKGVSSVQDLDPLEISWSPFEMVERWSRRD